MTRAILSLGANLGDREQTIRDAVRALRALDGVTVSAASGLVETPALKAAGVDVDAPAYLNAAVAIETTLSPEALLAALNGIERDHGRVRAERWGDRTLDIDIVTMGGLQRSDERLTLPHPRAAERAFVLRPWLEIDPHAELPGLGRVDTLVSATTDEVRPYAAEALL
ncbi:MAG: 2-amino-4-hydroxy-6-hydroxymethyldihydropteridine pyrophosphokinae [Glaciihabitans sp.]|nr:2-amino-4-hydroxy-6-hydroxymethyldihydropteridine pyrophosphokinae [Glaciihabitans sp.]